MNMTTIRTDRYQQEEVLSAVLSADSLLLLCHISPDGDTLGSALAMSERLRRLGKRTQVMVDGVIPPNLTFLPGAGEVLSPEAEVQPYDLALSIDVSCPERMGRCDCFWKAAPETALLDHHGTNDGFAHWNMIDPEAPATAIVVYRLFERMGTELTQEEAICLYTALSTDTGNFIYESTNAESFAMMSALLRAGLPLVHYSRMLFRQKEEAFVRLLGQVLPTLRVLCDGRVAGLSLTREQMRLAGAENGHTDGIVDYAIDIKGVQMAYFARELEDGRTKVSFRSLPPYGVDGIAAGFGGGGHRYAAAASMSLPLEEAVRAVEAALEAAL